MQHHNSRRGLFTNAFQIFFSMPSSNKVDRGIRGSLLLPVHEKLPCLRPRQKDLHCSTARAQLVDKQINGIDDIGAKPILGQSTHLQHRAEGNGANGAVVPLSALTFSTIQHLSCHLPYFLSSRGDCQHDWRNCPPFSIVPLERSFKNLPLRVLCLVNVVKSIVPSSSAALQRQTTMLFTTHPVIRMLARGEGWRWSRETLGDQIHHSEKTLKLH